MKTFFTSLLTLFFLGFAINVQAQINCNTNMNMSLDNFGQGTLTPEMFLEGNPVYDSAVVSPTTVDCSDLGMLTVTVTTTTAGVSESCFSLLNLEDKTAPVVVTDLYVNVCLDANDQYQLTPADLDNGTYDNCSSGANLMMTVSPSSLNATHLNTSVQVTLTATDESGNSNSTWSNVFVSSPSSTMSCNSLFFGAVTNPTDIFTVSTTDLLVSTDGCGAGVYVINLLDEFGNLITGGASTADIPGAGAYLYDITNTVTGNTCWGLIEITTNVTSSCGPLSCNDSIVAILTMDPNGNVIPFTMYTDNFLEGTYPCDLSTLQIDVYLGNQSNILASGIGSVSLGFSGIFEYVITDPGTGNSCWGTLEVQGNVPCPTANVYAPAALLEFNVVGINVANASQIFSPDNLINNYGTDPADAWPTYDPNTCSIMSIAYTDNVLDLGNGEFKIIREFTVVDWINQSVTTYVQIIKNLILIQYICDYLPHNTPITDCAQGHSANDDVEWPGNLMIDDHRIKPTELVNFSGVDPMDATPTFVNDPTLYSATYTDILKGLNATELIIDRQWEVTRFSLVGVAWNYTQEIIVDFSDFSGLVTAGSTTGRAVPGVEVSTSVSTDLTGSAYVNPGSNLITPTKMDEAINGVNVLDVILMNEHILGQNTLNQHQVIAADLNGSNTLTSLDQLLATKVILKESTATSDWIFLDANNDVTTTIKPRANYIALKQGDLNDDAHLSGPAASYPTIGASFNDVLLNQGQSYLVPVEIDATQALLGMEMRFLINASDINITDVVGVQHWNVTSSGELVVFIVGNIDPSTAVFQIELEALNNGILSQNLDFYSNQASLVVNQNRELVEVIGRVENVITSGNDNLIADLGFRIYPNPASQVLNIDSDVSSEAFDLIVYDMTGKQVSKYNSPSQIDLSNFNSGIYTYQIRYEDQVQTGKLSIIK